jgi:type II restriction enzyme
MKNYLRDSTKDQNIVKLINEALEILESVGIPVNEKSLRGQVKMAMSFLAVAGVTKNWKQAKSLKDSREMKTREIISFINEHFEEKISPGSYDDIRRKDLKLLMLAELIVNSGKNPKAATNDPSRGYSLETEFRELIIHFNTQEWPIKLKIFNKNKPALNELLERKRLIQKIPVTLSVNKVIQLSKGSHNELQREIVEEFLPRFAQGCEVLYIGDTSNKILHIDEIKLTSLGFFTLRHDELPDIVAYTSEKNWLYLIEAVHSSGPINEIRKLELKKLLGSCTAEIIFVTAFISRKEYVKWASQIAWETEVWLADNPDHMIHFNGNKFMGPYQSKD